MHELFEMGRILGRLTERMDGLDQRLSKIEGLFNAVQNLGLRVMLVTLLISLAIIINMPAGKVMERAAAILNDALN